MPSKESQMVTSTAKACQLTITTYSLQRQWGISHMWRRPYWTHSRIRCSVVLKVTSKTTRWWWDPVVIVLVESWWKIKTNRSEQTEPSRHLLLLCNSKWPRKTTKVSPYTLSSAFIGESSLYTMRTLISQSSQVKKVGVKDDAVNKESRQSYMANALRQRTSPAHSPLRQNTFAADNSNAL